MALPTVFSADHGEVRKAAERIRERVVRLHEPRMYQMALVLTVLARRGAATIWTSWGTPPPTSAKRIGRPEFVGAMWDLFGTPTNALIKPSVALRAQMDSPNRVMLDVLYGANGPLTLVGDHRFSPSSPRDSVKVDFSYPSWVWSADGYEPAARIAEYNPVNTLNQQNGITCAHPTDVAVSNAPDDPVSQYEALRNDCPHRQTNTGSEPTCAYNAAVCGGMGEGSARAVTKPRLVAPPTLGSRELVFLPGSPEALIAQATRGTRPLPDAVDLALLTSWCHTGGSGVQGSSRLLDLIGADGLRLLTNLS